MTRRRAALLALLAAVVVIGAVVYVVTRKSEHSVAAPPFRAERAAAKVADKVTVRGSVFDRDKGNVVGGVTVVFLGKSGEATTVTSADGSYSISVRPGRYRPFVRDTDMISTGLQDRLRLDNGPNVALPNLLDEELVPTLDVDDNLDAIDLTVARAAVISGTISNLEGDPVAGAIVRLREPPTRGSSIRPVLGSDVATSDGTGHFELRVPAGVYEIDARHHDYAGLYEEQGAFPVDPGAHETLNLMLTKGCIVRGKVVTHDGKPANDGAIETNDPARISGFGPSGRVEPDGQFEWMTTDNERVDLRAWPWRSPPSVAQSFECADGKRFTNAVLRMPDWEPHIAGTLVDAHGNPAPLTYVDITGLDPGLNGQQERSDASGTWHVYDMLPGHYRITASAAGRGIVEKTIIGPKLDVELQLGGTGRIVGTATQLVTGSLEVAFVQCGGNADPIEIAPETRIVPVRAGQFVIDGAPACALTVAVRWRDKTTQTALVVEPDATAHMSVDLGAARDKNVHGIVRDEHGEPASGARVTALIDEKEATTVRADANGRYTLTTRAGAQIIAGDGGKNGRATVGTANVPSEEVDVVLDGND